MVAAREQLQGGQLLLDEARLHQDAPSHGHDGVGRQHVGVGDVLVVGDLVAGRFGLGAGEPGHQRARHLALGGCSSIEDGRSASGSMPTWASKVRRRGEALASTSLGLSPARRPVGLDARQLAGAASRGAGCRCGSAR